MLDGYHIITLTHRDAPLEAVGQLVLREEQPELTLESIRLYFQWEELMYLATCNRVLILYYQSARADAPAADAETLLKLMRPDMDGRTRTRLSGSIQHYHGAQAIRHFMEVAASMDSLVVGEREIIRQLREAYDQNRQWGLTGDHLRLLLRFTIETAKEIYTQTGIGRKALSVVALAFQEMQAAGLQKTDRILMIGAGQTNALAAKFLDKFGFRNVSVFNRSPEKAEAIAEFLGGRAFPLDSLPAYREGFDAMIVCTGSTTPVITPDIYQALLDGDQARKIVVDLSVPNNVHPAIPLHFPVRHIAIEGLRKAADANLAFRESERQNAAERIEKALFNFRQRWHERQVERALAPITEEVKAVRERAEQLVFGREIEQLDPAARELVSRLLDYMEDKCVAIPMKTLKRIVLNAAVGRGSSK